MNKERKKNKNTYLRRVVYHVYDEKIIYETEKFYEQTQELHEDNSICEAFGVMNVYSQLYILDTDIRRAGINYEKI